MGLDNGIMIKRDTAPPEVLAAFGNRWKEEGEYDLGVAYWRGCWNVRSIILNTLNVRSYNNFICPMTYGDIDNVIEALRRMNKKNWLNYGHCSWEWLDFCRFQRRNIRNLRRLCKLMKTQNVLVYFYDSY